MSKNNSDESTPEDLIPRMGNLPISNARYFQSAVITRVTEPQNTSWNEAKLASQRRVTNIPPKVAVYNHQGTELAIADEQGTIYLLNGKTLQPIPSFQGLSIANKVKSLVFSPDGTRLAIANGANDLFIANAKTGELESVPKGMEGLTKVSCTSVFSTSQGAFCAGPYATAEGMSFFDLNKKMEIPLAFFGEVNFDEVTAIDAAFLPNEIRVLLGFRDGSIKWNTGEEVFSKQREPSGQPENPVVAVAFSPDGSLGLIASERGPGAHIILDTFPNTVFPLSLELPVVIDGISNQQFLFNVQQFLFNADGSQVTIISDKRLSIWDIGRAKIKPPVILNEEGLLYSSDLGEYASFCGAFHPDATALVGSNPDGWVYLVSIQANPISKPLSIPTPSKSLASARPAEGVLLTHEQSWTMEGISLGELLHSTSLAPGEITQIAISHHTESVMQHSVDTVAQREDLSQRGASASDLAEQEKTRAVEEALGGTVAASTSSTQSGGTNASFLIASTSSGFSNTQAAGVNVSYAAGGRNVSDESNQNVHQNTVQAAQMARSRSSASVREVSESDSLELQTRVVANYNHMHALTLQYYEVVQVQRLTTRITDAHRLLFIPMQPIHFDNETAEAVFRWYPRELAETLRSLGFPGAAFCVEFLMLGNTAHSDLREHRVKQIWDKVAKLKPKLASLNTRATDLSQPSKLEAARTAADTATHHVLQARTDLRKAKDPKPEVRDALRRILNTAKSPEEVKAAKDELETIQPADQATLAHLTHVLDQAVKVAKKATDYLNQITTEIANIAGQLYEAEKIQEEVAMFLEVSVNTKVGEIFENQDPSQDSLFNKRFETIKERILKILIDNQLAVNQGLWMRFSPSVYASLLQNKLFEGQSIGATLDPVPVAVTGSLVGFRWPHADAAEVDRFRHQYVNTAPLYQDAVAVPTGGVFGEAVLGESNTADRIDYSRFWNWKDNLPPIRPAAIDPLRQPTDAPPQTPTLATTPTSTINLGPISFPDVSSGISNITGALQNPDLFADLSGTKNSAEMTRNAMGLTADGADNAAEIASQNFRQQLEFQRKMASAAMDMLGGSDEEKSVDVNRLGAVLNSRDEAPSDGEENSDDPESDGALDLGLQVSYEVENPEENPAERPETPPEAPAEDQAEGTKGDDEDLTS